MLLFHWRAGGVRSTRVSLPVVTGVPPGSDAVLATDIITSSVQPFVKGREHAQQFILFCVQYFDVSVVLETPNCAEKRFTTIVPASSRAIVANPQFFSSPLLAVDVHPIIRIRRAIFLGGIAVVFLFDGVRIQAVEFFGNPLLELCQIANLFGFERQWALVQVVLLGSDRTGSRGVWLANELNLFPWLVRVQFHAVPDLKKVLTVRQCLRGQRDKPGQDACTKTFLRPSLLLPRPLREQRTVHKNGTQVP